MKPDHELLVEELLAQNEGPGQMLSTEQILAASDLVEQVVEVPEWGGAVRIRTMTKGAQIRLRKEATIDGKVDEERLELLMVVHAVVDPALTVAHVEQLKGKSAVAIDRIMKAFGDLSGFTPEAVKDTKKSFT